MSKAVLVMNMPSCCDECFALDEHGDYPVCIITQEQRGYTFRTREQKMDKCPFKPMPKKCTHSGNPYDEYGSGYVEGYNDCVDDILGD